MKLIENFSIVDFEEFSEERIWDIFITCGSFEDRCTRFSNLLKSDSASITHSIIFNYREEDKTNKKTNNIKKIIANLSEISKNILIFNPGSVSKPSEGIKEFLNFLKDNSIEMNDKKIVVDICTFTKPYLFVLFKVFKEVFQISEVDIVYTEPVSYKNKDEINDEIVMTEGLDRIQSIPGFRGSPIETQNALIVILGFEGKRSLEVFEEVEPNITFAINGFPSYKAGWNQISLSKNTQFLDLSGAHEHLFFTPANNPFETRNLIHHIVNELPESKNKNIIIAPLGSKMQAFGVLLFALNFKNISVVYPFPSSYKTDRSDGADKTWIFRTSL